MPRELNLDSIKFSSTLFLNLGNLFSSYFGTCVFYSGGNYETSRHSYLCLFPFELIWVKEHKLWRETINTDRHLEFQLRNPWDGLKAALPPLTDESSFPEWVGYVGYEMGLYSDPEKIIQSSHAPGIPHAYFIKPALVLQVDHQTGKGVVRFADQGQYLLGEEEREWIQRLSEPEKWRDLISYLQEDDLDHGSLPALAIAKAIETFDVYSKKVHRAKEWIKSGDIYQVNLSSQFYLRGSRHPYDVFKKLALRNPAPFSAFLNFIDFAIVSSSPERFLTKKEGWLETRPIKGTIARGKTIEEDKSQLEQLLNSPKESAELLMITDLMRNDLGKISIPGSVTTPQIRGHESYENVHHLLSIIRSEAIPGLHPIDILRSCFPGGSITGCPKLTAMQVISDLENKSRGIYTGSIGYFAGNGNFDFNIAIRTLLFKDDHIDLHLGGAIVADSDPQKEYEEILQKGASIFKVLQVENLEGLTLAPVS
jgi:para-aminobenzoate synthetase component I